MTEEQLIDSLRRGGLPALEALIDRYTPYVSAVISRILRGRQADVEELTADVFLTAWDNRAKLHPGQVKGYLGAIARNRAFNLLRASRESLPLEDDVLLLKADGPDRALDKKETARVLAQAAPAKKRRMPRWKTALIAAALAAGALLSIAAGLPGLVYQLANGTLIFTQTPNSKTTTVYSDVIMNLEDGRVFSLLNGGHVDVTDRISRDTPYIMDCGDPEAGLTHYVVMGGTPEDYGWFEWIVTPDPFTYEEGGPVQEGTGEGIFSTYVYHSCRWTLSEDGAWEVDRNGDRIGSGRFTWDDTMDVPPWLFAAMEELGIPHEYIPQENITTIHEK